jgi:PBSX family phage terminase large subunit
VQNCKRKVGEKMGKREDNLIPFTSDQDREKAKINGRKGGIASGKAKSFKSAMKKMLSLKLTEEEVKKNLQELGFDNEEMNIQTAIVYKQVKNAMDGDIRSAEFCRDTAGEYIGAEEEKEEQEKPIVYIPAKDMGKAFVDVYRDIQERRHLEYWFKGGRGSIKSSFWSEMLTEILENNPNMCAICIRQVANTLKDSAYAQTLWGIDKLGETYPFINENWKGTKSPLEIVNKNTGQVIYFRGADDPGKIKSIKPPKDKYIGVIVYEEFDQMKGMAEVRKIDQSVMRGGNDFVIFRVYNTPRSSKHFVNVEARIPKPNRLIHSSTYLDVPVEWLGQPFFDEAEYMKNTNYKIYANEYLGEETGDGGNVFENLELRQITDEEINNFDYTYQGIDFGWFPDPLAWTKCCYNPNQKALYIFDEFVVNKMSNADVWEYLKANKGVTEEDMIIADSAEPKSIGDFRMYGSSMRGAEKGPGSVEYSMKWLCSLAKIVIDPARCPVSAQEFSTYEYEQDKDGNYVSGYVDADNHCIDSIRYALNNIWRKRGQ